MKKIATLSAALVTMLLSTQALADTDNARFEPELEQRVAEFPWESGFIPDSGPIRLNLTATARQDVGVTLPGAAEYDWDTQMLSFAGDDNSGQFSNTVGADVTAIVSIDVFGFSTDVNVGLWGLEETMVGRFTPYVLSGAEPLEMEDSIGPHNLVAEPVEIGPASGMLYIDWRLDVPAVSYRGTRIDVSAEEGSANSVLASVTAENEEVSMVLDGAEPGTRATVYGTQYAAIDSEVSLHLLPTLSLDIYGITYDIGPFDVAIDYPLAQGQEMAFDALEMEFDVPEAEPEPEDEPEDEPDDGGDEPDDDGDDPEDEDEDPEDEGDTDDGTVPADYFEGESSDGCGCTSGTTQPSHLMFGLLAFAGLTLRRRRRR